LKITKLARAVGAMPMIIGVSSVLAGLIIAVLSLMAGRP
jgi:hypothetical protein